MAMQAEAKTVREAAVAGTFYPADRAALVAMMDRMLGEVKSPAREEKILAAVAPHAGYVYSGPVAAETFAALRGRGFRRVVVIAPSHYAAFDTTSVYDGDGYQTPLGTVPVDREFARRLAKMGGGIRLSQEGHAPTARGGEHAIEVELPWLQHVLGEFTLVPVVMGAQSYETSRELGVTLAKLIGEDAAPGETLVLASSDLSHYHGYEEAARMDGKTLAALEAWDTLSMARNFERRVWEACGGGPIVAAMIYAERRGANRARVLRYANSGDTAGDRTRVVGYSADLFTISTERDAEKEKFSLDEQEKKELLTIARESVTRAVVQGTRYEPAEPGSAKLRSEFGAFVTLTERGRLRGCIGYTAAVEPLYRTVRDVAMYAALKDPRFQPVLERELPELKYEISVLSPLRRVADAATVVVGRDGLLMKHGAHEGLLLPQVPVEQGWDRQTFLEQACVKAGLDRHCWRSEHTDIFRFTAEVF